MNEVKIKLTGRQPVSFLTINEIIHYVRSVYEEVGDKELDVKVIKSEKHTEVEIIIKTPSDAG